MSGRLFCAEEVFINDRRVRKQMVVEGTVSATGVEFHN